jgi:hypothetical protein
MSGQELGIDGEPIDCRRLRASMTLLARSMSVEFVASAGERTLREPFKRRFAGGCMSR